MAKMEVEVKAAEAAKDITVEVTITGLKVLKAKLAIARAFIWIACKIAGFGYEEL